MLFGSDSESCLTADQPDKKEGPGSSGSLCRYLIQDFIGEGCFGRVAKGVNLTTSQPVAIKILKTELTAKRELQMLKAVSILDPVKTNIVHFLEEFEQDGRICLVFEKLDRSLLQLLREQGGMPLSLAVIRPITHQLLMAFDALKDIGIIHSDLKPDNIMLVNHPSEPFRVKLIDFSLSFTTREKTRGLSIQPLGYRAPEVILGLPISEAIDMWGLGCVLGLLHSGNHLFSIHCEYQSMRGIVDTLGFPEDHLLCTGKYSHKFFQLNWDGDNPTWCMKTPSEYQQCTGIEPKTWKRHIRCLDDLITQNPKLQESTGTEDQGAFVSLLKSLLHPDPEQRIDPENALVHPFVSNAYLLD